jgi:hypothetical protein
MENAFNALDVVKAADAAVKNAAEHGIGIGGSQRGRSPATPPGMRVRTGRL